MEWYRDAAKLKNVEAEYNIGLLYAKGQGVEQDHAEAMKWFRMAADKSHVDAQAALAALYVMGQGVPRDVVQAHMWLSLAYASASEDETRSRYYETLISVENDMTEQQIAKSRHLARERGK